MQHLVFARLIDWLMPNKFYRIGSRGQSQISFLLNLPTFFKPDLFTTLGVGVNVSVEKNSLPYKSGQGKLLRKLCESNSLVVYQTVIVKTLSI